MRLLGSKKDVLKIFLFILFFYVPPGLLFFNHVRHRSTEGLYLTRKEDLQSVLDLIVSLDYAGHASEICSQLRAETRAERIILFSYQGKENTCSVPENTSPEKYPTAYTNVLYSQKVKSMELNYLKTDLESGSLVLGFESPIERPLLYYILNSRGVLSAMLIDFFLVLWVVMGFFILMISRNLDRIKGLYSNSNNLPFYLRWFEKAFGWLSVEDLKIIEVATQETTALMRKLQDNSKFEETSLQYSILADLRKQMEQGEQISFPYSFTGVVVRMDINGYSNIMRDMPMETTREVSTSFKKIAAELAYRYEGLFENSAGDEVVYCFKGQEPLLRGAAFARDLMQEFSAMKFHDKDGNTFQLFGKSSIYQSEMVMDFGAARIEFDGLALLYTNRMFADLPLKDRNVLIISPGIAESVQTLCKVPTEPHKIVAKGMPLEVQYITEFYTREQIASPTAGLFRTDREIIAILSELASSNEITDQNINELLNLTRVKVISESVIHSWIDCISKVSDNLTLQNNHPDLLPTLIGIGPELIKGPSWTPECSKILRKASLSNETRVTENSVEALVKAGQAEAAISLAPQKMTYRLRANRLIAHVLAQPNNEKLADLRMMATSSNEEERASGLYAAATVILLLREKQDQSILVLKEYGRLLRILEKAQNKKDNISRRVREKIRDALI